MTSLAKIEQTCIIEGKVSGISLAAEHEPSKFEAPVRLRYPAPKSDFSIKFARLWRIC